MAEKQQTITISIPEDIDAIGRVVLSDMIILFIEKRTSQGKNIFGSKFTAYSESYTKSKDFKNAGKSDKVNLELSGGTIGSIDLLSHSKGVLRLGYDKGSFENDKAAWLVNGENGPPRNFLGIRKDDLSIVIKKFRELDSSKETQQKSEARAIFRRLIGS